MRAGVGSKLAGAVAAGAAVLLAAGLRAADYDELIAGRKVDARFGRAPSGKQVLLLDGKPRALFWANLTAGGGDYRRAGFNTVLAELTYRQPTPGATTGRLGPSHSFPAWDELLLSIKRRGLFVNIYIHNNIHNQASTEPMTFDDPWQEYVRPIVERYRGITNLVGWTFSDEYADHLTYPTEAFQAFLRREYGTVVALNARWKTQHASFDEIEFDYERAGRGRPTQRLFQKEFGFGVGPIAFDSARFKVERTAWANQRFEEIIRQVDPVTPIWSGANNLCWPAPQIPANWGAFFDFYPEFSGGDWLTHHIWAMDIGRGPNARPAMQMLLPEHSGRYDWHLDARVLRGWMIESAIHGAAGITFWPWSFLGVDNRPGDRSTSIERVDMVGSTIRQLEAAGIFEMMPTPTIAVLYQPYAEGWGNMSQVYGVLRYPSGEPIPLLRELRFGTRYGQVEYLTSGTLPQARFSDYGTILCPFSCDLTAEHVALLRTYVERGGVLFADVGFDCIRAGKTVTTMSDEAKAMFGIRSLRISTAGPGDWTATGAFGDLLGGLEQGKDRTARWSKYLLDVEPSAAVAALRGPGGQGLYVNRVGQGYAIFCSALAWAEPTTADPVLRRIHEALFARRAKIALVETAEHDGTEQRPWYAGDYEIASFADGYAIQNRRSPDPNSPRRDHHRTMSVRTNLHERTHTLSPRTVILVRNDQVIPLGTGQWPVETGPVQTKTK